MDLNSPDTRQMQLQARLSRGQPLNAAHIALEFEVSPDTVRRDLIALERAGQARRVRGGAVPVARPAAPLEERLETEVPPGLVAAALSVIGDAPTLLLDGGTTVLALAEALPPDPGRLVVTPAPRVALACQRRGIEVVLLGGTLSPRGGIATGPGTEDQLTGIAADIAVLGACGLEAEFGLGADDLAEAGVKRVMAQAAVRTMVLTGEGKVGRRARHRVIGCDQFADLVTDAPEARTAAFAAAGVRVHHG
ncbi:DeoR/GlpR family DNA-binding transcription regulator [Oceaniglobus roseus]|uniref:DeoR/GlpR family DNA-binding transcription regulator n=1 Tax=Oceaniglobus roseus TaxID=1737570 RepID=UPI0013000DF7|nr:DeoR/GlpR family DNA-binding transcription regulator [Kandeliimicrobium roseum]